MRDGEEQGPTTVAAPVADKSQGGHISREKKSRSDVSEFAPERSEH